MPFVKNDTKIINFGIENTIFQNLHSIVYVFIVIHRTFIKNNQLLHHQCKKHELLN
jgi:hypothetical protein